MNLENIQIRKSVKISNLQEVNKLREYTKVSQILT